MPRTLIAATLLAILSGAILTVAIPARSETIEQTMDFAGNTIEVVQADDPERVLRVNGTEAFREFQIFLERAIPFGGRQVLHASAGQGGNACGSYPVILIPANDGSLTVATPLGRACGPFVEIAATQDRLIFFGFARPGIPASIDHWFPQGGLEHIGRIEFEPQPGTGWDTLSADERPQPRYLFDNADVFNSVSRLAGDDLGKLALSLAVAPEVELVAGRFLVGMGCTPHACGAADGLIAVDLEGRAVYAATDATDQRSVWPEAERWPPALRDTLEAWGRGER